MITSTSNAQIKELAKLQKKRQIKRMKGGSFLWKAEDGW